MTPQAPEQAKVATKLGRNPFGNKPLKVGVKKTHPSPETAEITPETNRKTREFSKTQDSSEAFDFKNAARGVRYLIEGFFYDLTIKVMKKISDRIPT